jgi:hypothetical protein
MPCHAIHPIQDLFLESFSYELQFDMQSYMHSYLRKSFYSCKKWVSQKALVDVVLPEVTPLKADLTNLEHPIKILVQKDRVTRHKTVKFFKVQWRNHSEEEATCESKDFLHSHHPEFVLA